MRAQSVDLSYKFVYVYMSIAVKKLVTNNLQVAQSAFQKQGGIISAATKPIEAGSEKLITGALRGLAASNSVLVKKSSTPELVDETIELLSGCTRKHLSQDLSNLSPQNMVLVHATDYFPEGGIIRTTANATLARRGQIKPIFKVHCAINHFVNEHPSGCWDYKCYSILMPMDKIMKSTPKENLIGGQMIDFYIRGDVRLPDGSVIIKSRIKGIPDGEMRISKLGERSGITVIETPRDDIKEFTNKIINKMGYDNLTKNDLYEVVPKSYDEILLEQSGKSIEEIKIEAITTPQYKLSSKINNAWKIFAEKYGFINMSHTYSPYGKSEYLLNILSLLSVTKENSWQYIPTKENSYFKPVNYKKILLETIDNIKKQLGDSGKLDYDIDKLKEIIEQSAKPSDTLDKIRQVFNFQVGIYDMPDINGFSDMVYTEIDTMLGITDIQKKVMACAGMI